jgi:hypothetical protein
LHAQIYETARVSFYGNFGAGNLGNEATLQAVIEQILGFWGVGPTRNCFVSARTQMMYVRATTSQLFPR